VSLKTNQNAGDCTGGWPSLAFGSSCAVACGDGYMASGNLTVECTTPNTTGVQSPGTCVPLPCRVTVGANQALGACGATLAFGSTCDTTCNAGYEASAPLRAACTTAPNSTIAFSDICDRMCILGARHELLL
jgi:hypothetical protein